MGLLEIFDHRLSGAAQDKPAVPMNERRQLFKKG